MSHSTFSAHVTETNVDTGPSLISRFFPLWDNSRQALLPAYAPSATFTISANPTPSRSLIATNVETTRHERPRSAPFTSYVELPSRNFLRAATSIETRMETLKSAAQPDKLVEFWKKVPGTVHPLTDGTKWAFDSWILDEWVDGASGEARASAILSIEGEFQECTFLWYCCLDMCTHASGRDGWCGEVLISSGREQVLSIVLEDVRLGHRCARFSVRIFV